jgi:hypothetical protein
MPEHLFDRLNQLRARVRYVVGVYGVCWFIVVFFLTALVAGGLDWLWHIDDSGVRFLFLLGVVGSSLYVAWRYLYRPLAARLTDVELAARIEQQNPGLEDSLTSTVQFLQAPDDERVGSTELQKSVINSTLAELDRVQVDSVVETKPVQKLAWSAVLTCAVVALVVGFNQAEASTAIQRLIFPFSNTPWPRQFELQFVNQKMEPLAEGGGALTAVQGETLELFVENKRGGLPRDLTFFYRRSDGKIIEDKMRQATLYDDDRNPREIGGATLVISSGPLFFWAKGGDGETLPFQIDVVPPPKIESLNVYVTHPKYTRKKAESLPQNVGHVEGYIGSQVKFNVRVNKPLKMAELHCKDEILQSLKLSDDGLSLHGEFKLEHPGAYSWWLTLRDREGFANPDADRFEVRALPDAAPDIHFDEPKSDVFVTSTATVGFVVSAKDDLMLKGVRLLFESDIPAVRAVEPADDSDDGGDLELRKQPKEQPGTTTRPGANQPISTKRGESGAFVLAENSDQEQLTLRHSWDLTPHNFAPGARIKVVAEATDWYDLGDPHIGVSNSRTLIVVSKVEKERELADRQESLLLDLERIEKIQTSASEHVRDLKTQLEKAGILREEDLDLLKRVEMDQRQIESRLTDETDSVAAQAKSLKEEMQANGVKNPDVRELLETLDGELEFLSTGPLPELQKTLTQTLKRNSSSGKSKDKVKQTKKDLDSAAARQDEVLNTLRNVLGDLSKWRNERNLSAEVRELSGDQNKLIEDTKAISQETQGKTAGQLNRQDKADLSKLANRQQKLSERIAEFKDEIAKTKKELDAVDPERAQTLKDALNQLKKSDIASKMRQASGNLNQNRVSEVVTKQQEVVEELRKLRDVLENREVTDAESLVKRLDETQQQMANLRNEQEDLLKKINQQEQQQGGKQPQTPEDEAKLEKLRRRQQELRQELDEMVRRLQRLQSPAQQAADRAAQQMQKGEQALSDGDTESAQEDIQESLDDLEQAMRELADDKKEAEEQLAQELIEKIEPRLKGMLLRQNGIILALKQLDKERQAAGGGWSRRLLKSLKNLAQVQRNLANETRSAAEAVSVVEVLEMALTGAARYMDRAAKRIDDRDAGVGTQAVQELAAKRFLDMLDALKKDDSKPKDGQPQQNGNDNGQKKGGNNGPQGDAVTLIAQLKVMRALQADLIARVKLIRTEKAETGKFTADQQEELADIADAQSRLADLAREMTSFFGDPDVEEAPLGTDNQKDEDK